MSLTEVRATVSNGIPVPDLDLTVNSFSANIQFDVTLALPVSYPNKPEVITRHGHLLKRRLPSLHQIRT